MLNLLPRLLLVSAALFLLARCDSRSSWSAPLPGQSDEAIELHQRGEVLISIDRADAVAFKASLSSAAESSFRVESSEGSLLVARLSESELPTLVRFMHERGLRC